MPTDRQGYMIIYIHTTLSPENEPSFAWLRKVYDLFDRRLKVGVIPPRVTPFAHFTEFCL